MTEFSPAVESARAAAENARRLIDALESVADFGEDAFADLKQSVNEVFNTLAPIVIEHERLTIPPADDEREALFGLIYRYETIDFAESQNFTTRDCRGVVETILAAGFRRRGPVTEDDYEVGYAEGFHHGRSTPIVPPITDDQVEAVANIMSESEDTGSLETARAALEAARAVE